MEITWSKFNLFKSNNKPVTNMKQFEKISKALGREITSENVGAVTAEEWGKVDASMDQPAPAAETETQDLPAPTEGLTAESVQQIVTTSLTAALAPISSRLEAIEKGPAATETDTPIVDGGEKKAVHAWEDPNDAIAQQALKDLGQA